MAELTPHRRERLARIMVMLSEEREPLTFREIGRRVGLGAYAVWTDMQALRDMGYITYTPNANRSIRVVIPFYEQQHYLHREQAR